MRLFMYVPLGTASALAGRLIGHVLRPSGNESLLYQCHNLRSAGLSLNLPCLPADILFVRSFISAVRKVGRSKIVETLRESLEFNRLVFKHISGKL